MASLATSLRLAILRRNRVEDESLEELSATVDFDLLRPVLDHALAPSERSSAFTRRCGNGSKSTADSFSSDRPLCSTERAGRRDQRNRADLPYRTSPHAPIRESQQATFQQRFSEVSESGDHTLTHAEF